MLSYMTQVNCSVTLNTGDDVTRGTNAEDDAVVNLSVTVGSDFQVFQADFFPLLLNCDVTSHLVKAEGQRLTLIFIFTKFQADGVNVIVPKVLPYTKSNPQIQVRLPMHKTVENSNKYHNHVHINSFDKNGCCIFPRGIMHMQRDPAVCLFVVTLVQNTSRLIGQNCLSGGNVYQFSGG